MFTVVVLACLSFASGSRLPARIVGGSNTDTTAHPHQVSLEWAGNGFSHVCGASIIASRWVVTAAHCVEFDGYDPARFRIATNNGNLDDPNKGIYTIQKIIPHESYNPNSGLFQPAFPNDIALLELNNDITGAVDKAISLMEGTSLDGLNCTISGWGFTETGTDSSVKEIPNTLQQTTGRILTRSQCESTWNTALYPSYSHSVHVCIDDRTSGSCNGDSGGPMVCNGKLAGVTSWGAAGCDTTMPSVYVRIPNYVSWINNKMA